MVTASGASGLGPCPAEMTGEDALLGERSYWVTLEMSVGSCLSFAENHVNCMSL